MKKCYLSNPERLTKHHITPRSRNHRGIVGVCIVPNRIHNLSHQLFGNMKPDEIVDWLNTTLWDNSYEINVNKKKTS